MIVDIPTYNGPGVYMIKNSVTGRVYIGSSINCNARLKRHSKHPQNKAMEQDACKGFFTAQIIKKFPEGCTNRQLADEEYAWRIKAKDEYGDKCYNSHYETHCQNRGNLDDFIYYSEQVNKYDEKSKERTMRYMKERRDKLTLNLPAGDKERYKKHAEQKRGKSLTKLIVDLLEEDIKR